MKRLAQPFCWRNVRVHTILKSIVGTLHFMAIQPAINIWQLCFTRPMLWSSDMELNPLTVIMVVHLTFDLLCMYTCMNCATCMALAVFLSSLYVHECSVETSTSPVGFQRVPLELKLAHPASHMIACIEKQSMLACCGRCNISRRF